MGLLQSNYPSLPLPAWADTETWLFSTVHNCSVHPQVSFHPDWSGTPVHGKLWYCAEQCRRGSGKWWVYKFPFVLKWALPRQSPGPTLYYSLGPDTQFHIYKKHVASTVVTCYYVPPPALYYSLRPTTQYAFTQKLCTPCKRTHIYCSLGRHQLHKKLMTLHIRIQTIHRLTWTLNTRHPNTQY